MTELWLTLALLAGVGALAGYLSGLFGIGGGAVMVPALYFVFRNLGVAPDIVMHCAVATSAAVIIVNGWRSARDHWRRGSVDMDLLWPKGRPWQSYGLWIALGSFMAALILAPRLSSDALTLIFACVALIVALQFIVGRPEYVIRDTVPLRGGPPVIGGTIGALSAVMGIGGGSLSVPFLTLFGVPIHRAIGTAAGFGLMIAVPATLGYVVSGWNVAGRAPGSLGFVCVPGVLLIIVFAWAMVPLGVASAHRLDARFMRRLFGAGLALIALNMLRLAVSG